MRIYMYVYIISNGNIYFQLGLELVWLQLVKKIAILPYLFFFFFNIQMFWTIRLKSYVDPGNIISIMLSWHFANRYYMHRPIFESWVAVHAMKSFLAFKQNLGAWSWDPTPGNTAQRQSGCSFCFFSRARIFSELQLCALKYCKISFSIF